MKPERPPFPEKLFYEGNARIGNTLQAQIGQEEALYQFEKKIISLKTQLDLRRSNYRNYEEYIDSREKNIKQAITDMRTETCLRLLEIQKESEDLVQLEKAATSTLKHIIRKIQKNQIIINKEKEKILNNQDFEITTTQYNEVLEEQNQNLKNEMLFNNFDYQIKSQITWYSNEYYVLDSKISEISSRLPTYDSEAKKISDKIEKKIQCIEYLNAIKNDFSKSYPQKDDINLKQKKIKQLQKEAKRILCIVREYHEIQKDLVSRISTLTTRFVKCDVLVQKLHKYISQYKTKEDTNNYFKFDKMIIDDDKERSDQIIKNNSKKIFSIKNSIKEHQSALERQISDTKSATNDHKKTIHFLIQQINEYSKQQNSLNEQLLECKELSCKYDQKYQKIEKEIKEVNNLLCNLEQSESLATKIRIPKIAEPPLRQFQYELDQIHGESNLKLKINLIQDQISLFKNQIHQYEKNNSILQQKILQKKAKIEKLQRNVYKPINNSNKISYINKLKPIIIDLERLLSKKSISISKKKDRIKFKLIVINNAQKCGNECGNCPGLANNIIEIHKSKFNDIQKWIIRIERELLKWEMLKTEEPVLNYLNKWNKKLSEISTYYLNNGGSE